MSWLRNCTCTMYVLLYIMLVDGNEDRVDATHIYVADCEYCTTHMDIYIMSVNINSIHCTQIMNVCYDHTMYLYFSWC